MTRLEKLEAQALEIMARILSKVSREDLEAMVRKAESQQSPLRKLLEQSGDLQKAGIGDLGTANLGQIDDVTRLKEVSPVFAGLAAAGGSDEMDNAARSKNATLIDEKVKAQIAGVQRTFTS